MRRNGVKHMTIAGKSVSSVSSMTIWSGTLATLEFKSFENEIPSAALGCAACMTIGRSRPATWLIGLADTSLPWLLGTTRCHSVNFAAGCWDHRTTLGMSAEQNTVARH